MKFTGAKTKREAVVTALERFNRLKRLERLNARVRGQFRDFMTQADLKATRAADTPRPDSSAGIGALRQALQRPPAAGKIIMSRNDAPSAC
jgi:hypothetical protein